MFRLNESHIKNEDAVERKDIGKRGEILSYSIIRAQKCYFFRRRMCFLRKNQI